LPMHWKSFLLSLLVYLESCSPHPHLYVHHLRVPSLRVPASLLSFSPALPSPF
jgi:hypothetical protein